MTETSLYNS